jgi:hypothetical protein
MGGIIAEITIGNSATNLSETVTIDKCYNTGTVQSCGSAMTNNGGIAGYIACNANNTDGMNRHVNISNCYNTGTVEDLNKDGGQYVGGLIGNIDSTTRDVIFDPQIRTKDTAYTYNYGDVSVSNCYVTGGVLLAGTASADCCGLAVGCFRGGNVKTHSDSSPFYTTSKIYTLVNDTNIYYANKDTSTVKAALGSASVYLLSDDTDVYTSVFTPKTPGEMRVTSTGGADILTALGGAFKADTDSINGGYPVLTSNNSAAGLYNVTADTSVIHGTVEHSVSGTVPAGAKVVIKVTPDRGYKAQSVSFISGGGQTTPVVPVNGVYSFTMPDSAVTVTAVFTDANNRLLLFDDVWLTEAQLYDYSSTFIYTRSGSEEQYACEGIYISDLLAHLASLDDSVKVLTFCSSDGTSKSEVTKEELTSLNAMLAWKVNGKAQQPLRVVLNGTAGSRWTSGVDNGYSDKAILTVKSLDNYFSDVTLTRNQLEAYKSAGTNYVMNPSKNPVTYTSVTGITLSSLLANYVPYGAHADEVKFYDVYDTSGSNIFYPQDAAGYGSAMLLWNGVKSGETENSITGLRSALNGGSGKYWWSGINTVGVSLQLSSVTISANPSSAAVEIKDSMGKLITPSEGAYTLVQGETYSYSASAAGYIAKDGTFIPDEATETVPITLQSGGSSGATYYTVTGYNGTYGTVTPNKTTAEAGETITLTVSPADN